MGVEPRKDGLEKEYAWPEEPLVAVPEITGMDKEDLSRMLMNLEVEVSGEGTKVITQAPEPGVKVPTGSTVRVYLGD